jgi:hypothetical protein
MQGGDVTFLMHTLLRVFPDGNITVDDEIDGAVRSILMKNDCILGIDLLIEQRPYDVQLIVREPTEHAVLAEEIIVNRTYCHAI